MVYTAILRVRNLEDLALTAFDIDAMYSDSRVESLYDEIKCNRSPLVMGHLQATSVHEQHFM